MVKRNGGKWTDTTREIICARVLTGKSLRKISTADDMPAFDTIMTWFKDNEAFRKAYEEAYELRVTLYEDDAKDLLDDATMKDLELARAKSSFRERRIDARRRPNSFHLTHASDPDNPLKSETEVLVRLGDNIQKAIQEDKCPSTETETS